MDGNEKEREKESPQAGSNHRPFAYEASALPLSYRGLPTYKHEQITTHTKYPNTHTHQITNTRPYHTIPYHTINNNNNHTPPHLQNRCHASKDQRQDEPTRPLPPINRTRAPTHKPSRSWGRVSVFGCGSGDPWSVVHVAPVPSLLSVAPARTSVVCFAPSMHASILATV